MLLLAILNDWFDLTTPVAILIAVRVCQTQKADPGLDGGVAVGHRVSEVCAFGQTDHEPDEYVEDRVECSDVVVGPRSPSDASVAWCRRLLAGGGCGVARLYGVDVAVFERSRFI